MPFPHRPMQETQVGLAREPLQRDAEYMAWLAVTQNFREVRHGNAVADRLQGNTECVGQDLRATESADGRRGDCRCCCHRGGRRSGRRCRGGRISGLVGHGPERASRVAEQGRGLLAAHVADFTTAMMRGDRRDRGMGGIQCASASRMLREAAAMTTQITGEVIPSDKPGCSPWRCASPSAWSSASRRGTRRSSSACARSPCRSRAATPSSSRRRRSARARTA